MLATSFRPLGLAAFATLVIAGCASSAMSPSEELIVLPRVPSLTPTSRVIDAERIRRSGAQTAWDAVRLLVPTYRFQSGRALALGMLPSSDTERLDSSVRLVIDGHRLADVGALHALPAQEILAIHVLNATEAAIHFGLASGSGAIVIQTRAGLRRI